MSAFDSFRRLIGMDKEEEVDDDAQEMTLAVAMNKEENAAAVIVTTHTGEQHVMPLPGPALDALVTALQHAQRMIKR